MKSFASDNYSPACIEVLQTIQEANRGHVPSYGNDSYTEHALDLLKKTFGSSSYPYFVYNGTAANTLALKAITRSHHSIICSDSAHMVTQEVGAVVNLTGCSLIPVPNIQGKITADLIEESYLKAVYWGRHNNLPKVVSISQTTEYGTVYSLDELTAIASACRKNKLLFHLDGCRLANAAVALQTSLKALTAEIGVDVLSFGGTKNGLFFGEVIIFFHQDLAQEFEYIQKQGLQLNSKMRFLSAQFIPYLEKNIWHRNAQQANLMCLRLAEGLTKREDIKLAYPVQSNQLFAYFPKSVIAATQSVFPYYVWNEKLSLVRLVTSFDITEEDVDKFIALAMQT